MDGGTEKLPAGATSRSLGLPALTLVLAGLLLVPWLRMLAALWTGSSKDSVSSALAFGAALWIGWRNRAAILRRTSPPSAIWAAALAAATLAYVASARLDFRAGVALSAALLLAALLGLWAGAPAVRTMAPALCLLCLAAPIPGSVQAALTIALLDVAVLTVHPLLSLLAPVEVAGYVLRMPLGEIRIIDDCSGLGGILLFVPLTFVLAYLHWPLSAARCVAVAACALPLALLASILRILCTGCLAAAGSSLAMSETLHEILGLALLAAALLVLLRMCRGRRAPEPRTP